MILAPNAPNPPAKLKLHVEQAIDAMHDLLEFLHAQETPWHPGEIGFLLTAATHHFMEKNGITTCQPTPVVTSGACAPLPTRAPSAATASKKRSRSGKKRGGR